MATISMRGWTMFRDNCGLSLCRRLMAARLGVGRAGSKSTQLTHFPLRCNLSGAEEFSPRRRPPGSPTMEPMPRKTRKPWAHCGTRFIYGGATSGLPAMKRQGSVAEWSKAMVLGRNEYTILSGRKFESCRNHSQSHAPVIFICRIWPGEQRRQGSVYPAWQTVREGNASCRKWGIPHLHLVAARRCKEAT